MLIRTKNKNNRTTLGELKTGEVALIDDKKSTYNKHFVMKVDVSNAKPYHNNVLIISNNCVIDTGSAVQCIKYDAELYLKEA